ncbi:MAG: DUF2802 domain-containing protein [Gammaproteobacteria bacterium]
MNIELATAYAIGIGGLLLAGTCYGAVFRARQKIDTLEALLGLAEARIDEIETQFKSLDPRVGALCDQADRLAMRQARLDSTASRSGFEQARELTRHGAEASELVDTCGLNGGEARLVKILYGCEGTDT